MASKIIMATLFVALAAVLLQTTDAANYTVGDATGWIVPSNTEFYDNWAENKTFAVGDVLVFNFATGAHDVAEVTETAYDACTKTNPISTLTTGPATITLNRTGDHYYICTFGTHCSGGQKVKIEVSTNNSTSPSNSPPGVSSPPPPPSGSSASSVVATVSLVLMSIAFALFC